jgi:hypothetical protein
MFDRGHLISITMNVVRLEMFSCSCSPVTVSPRLPSIALIPIECYSKETTGQSLAATLGFIAIHPNIQDEVVEQIMSVVGSERDPVRHTP